MRADIAFSSDDSHRFLPWLIGMMVCLAALLLCFVITINGWVVSKNSNYSNSLTVNIPASYSDGQPSDEVVAKVIDALQKTSGIESISRMEQGKLQKLLVPWLGENIASSSLPLPVVLDITTINGSHINIQGLQENLSQIAPGTEIDAHESWVAAFMKFSSAIRALMALLSALIIVVIAMMIAFTSRTSLHIHSKAVRLLHSIGAEDKYIAKQFQQEACMLTIKGATAGCAIAAFAFWGMDYYTRSLENSSIPSLSMGESHFAMLLAFILVCTIAAWVSARIGVMGELKKTP